MFNRSSNMISIFKNHKKFILFLGLLFILFSVGFMLNPQKAFASKIDVNNSGHHASNLPSIVINVLITSINGKRPGSFNGDSIVQSGTNYYLKYNGNQIKIPAALTVKVYNAGYGQQMATYCIPNSSDTIFYPCGSSDDLCNPILPPYVTKKGEISYSCYFSPKDLRTGNNSGLTPLPGSKPGSSKAYGNDYVAYPSGPNLRVTPGFTSNYLADLKNWTVNSCGSCTTVLGVNGNIDHNQKINLSLPLATSYVSPTIAPVNNGQGAPSSTPTCTSSAGVLGWIMCPIFDAVANSSKWILNNLIQPLLVTKNITTNPANPIYQTWSNFRLYANIFLVIILLIVVLSEAIGGGLIDAYTVKKIMPRILLVAILINLSIYIVAGLVDITNILGGGILQIMTLPFAKAGNFNFNLTAPNAAGLTAIFGGGATIVGLSGILTASSLGAALPIIGLFVILPVLIALFATFIVILLRTAVIDLLVLISPIAFALYCLPNTEKYFKKWWGLLVQTLLVYPFIMAIFGLCYILSTTMSKAGGGPVGAIIALVALFLPLFLVPFAFKITGGVVGKLYGSISGFGSKTHEAIKGERNNPNSLRNKTKRTLFESMARGQNRVIRTGIDNLNATGWQKRRGQFARAVGGNVNSRMSRYTREAQEREEQESATGYDGYRYAANYITVGANEVAPASLTSGGRRAVSIADHTRYFDSKGREISEVMAKGSAARHAKSEHDSGRNLEYTLRKAQSDDDLANYRLAFAATAKRLGLNDDELADMHARSTFEHKKEFPSEWFSTPTWGTNAAGNRVINWADVADPAGRRGQNRQVRELFNTKGGWELGSIRNQDIRSWDTRRNQIQAQWARGATVSDSDAQFYAMSNGILDQMVQRNIINRDGDEGPAMQSSGASAATAAALKSLMQNRKFETTPELIRTTPTGNIYSTNVHTVYDPVRVNALTTAPGGVGPTLSRDAAIQAAAVPQRVTLFGDADRTNIPRSA